MDTSTMNIIAEMGTNLSILAFKGTATAKHNRIQILKTEKNMEQLRNTYDEMINQLLTEREEAIRIAQAYKEELDKVEISDEDILTPIIMSLFWIELIKELGQLTSSIFCIIILILMLWDYFQTYSQKWLSVLFCVKRLFTLWKEMNCLLLIIYQKEER